MARLRLHSDSQGSHQIGKQDNALGSVKRCVFCRAPIASVACNARPSNGLDHTHVAVQVADSVAGGPSLRPASNKTHRQWDSGASSLIEHSLFEVLASELTGRHADRNI